MPITVVPTPAEGTIAPGDALSWLVTPRPSVGYLDAVVAYVSYDEGATWTEAYRLGPEFENGFTGTGATGGTSPTTLTIDAPPWTSGPLHVRITADDEGSSFDQTFVYDVSGGPPGPRVSGAEATDQTHVRVTFNSAMGASGLTAAAHYAIAAQHGSAPRTVRTVHADQAAPPRTSVTLELDGPLSFGSSNYTVTASSVQNEAGTPIDSSHRSANFSGLGHATPAIASHCELGKSRLLAQFKNKPRLEGLICAIGDQFQAMEQALADILAFSSLKTAFGKSLDLVGGILRVPRTGLLDTFYRPRLAAKAQVIASFGHPNDLLRVLQTLDDGFAPGDISLREDDHLTSVLTCRVQAGRLADGPDFARYLARTASGGTRAILEYVETGVTLFAFIETSGDTGASGSGWTEDRSSPQGHWREAADGR